MLSPKMSTNYLPLNFMLTLLLLLASAKNTEQSKQTPAMYVFGDSLVDCGNNNYLNKNNPANFLPYGIDFGRPTGRFTNGKTVVDFLAIHLGLPFAPAYWELSRNEKNTITTGINYASAGSGILPDKANGSFVLDSQIWSFEMTVKENLAKRFGDRATLERYLSESLFVVSTGVNDHFHDGTFRGGRDFASYLIKEFSIRLQRLYSLGARKFFLNNVAPAGCFPLRAMRSRPKGKCDKKINKGISYYNRKLPGLLHELKSQLPGFTYVLSDLNKFLTDIRKKANKYGIVETWKTCCPDNNIGGLACGPNCTVCANRNAHLFFDEHPTQIVNEIYARKSFIEQAITTPPIRLRQL